MTNENKLAVIDKTDAVNFPSTFKGMRRQAKEIFLSGLCGDAVKKESAVLAIAMYGREYGLGMMTSINSLYVVKGRVTMSAQLMHALAENAGHWLYVIETTAKQCVIEFYHKNRPDKPYAHTFTMEDAKTAGNSAKDNYKKHPKNMLRARCIAEGCRLMYPSVINNMHTPEEMGAMVDEDGQVVTINQFDDQAEVDETRERIENYINNPELASVFFSDWCKENGYDVKIDMTVSFLGAFEQYVFTRMSKINAGDTTIESELETPLDPEAEKLKKDNPDPDPGDKPDNGDDEYLT